MKILIPSVEDLEVNICFVSSIPLRLGMFSKKQIFFFPPHEKSKPLLSVVHLCSSPGWTKGNFCGKIFFRRFEHFLVGENLMSSFYRLTDMLMSQNFFGCIVQFGRGKSNRFIYRNILNYNKYFNQFIEQFNKDEVLIFFLSQFLN